MNNIAKVKCIARYKKVVYYSVCIDKDDEVSLFELFVKKHTNENKDKLNHILKWIQKIGNYAGADESYFRNEAEYSDTSALPPPGVNKEPKYIEYGSDASNNLRLYCFRVNYYVVFLYSGDIKTSIKAQECENVKEHFNLANKLTEIIDKNIRDGVIKWNSAYTDICIDDTLELKFEL